MAIFNYTDAGRFYYVGSQIITNKLTGTVYYISLVEKVVIAYKGKSKKPFIYTRFKTVERMKEAVSQNIQSDNLSHQNAIKNKEEQKARIKKFRDQLEIGTILYTSWGYEQTNVDFYQVIEKSGAYCVIRELKQAYDATGSMQGYVVPLPNEFTSKEPMKKKIMDNYIVIHQSANAIVLDFELLPTGTKVYKRCYTSSYA